MIPFSLPTPETEGIRVDAFPRLDVIVVSRSGRCFCRCGDGCFILRNGHKSMAVIAQKEGATDRSSETVGLTSGRSLSMDLWVTSQ